VAIALLFEDGAEKVVEKLAAFVDGLALEPQ